ncbi:MAG TPA: T9SS type A sorting domain-containing protein [Chitinophagales bacterium]|nr:T9SS type A sorting domain-containing protein [Chitinophagales bacterium]
MFRSWILILLTSAGLYAKAQYVALPDTSFTRWLKNNGYAQCFNGDLLDTTCPKVLSAGNITCVHPYHYNIRDITGIQYFKNLDTLDCRNDSLSFLPVLPAKIKVLYCTQNFLTQLPELPDSLLILICVNNQLTILPSLPSTLQKLACGMNQLQSLPALPSHLTQLDCDDNNLSELPELPDSLGLLACFYNYNLLCFPYIKTITNLIFDNTGITCVPDYGNVTTSLPDIHTLPLCDSVNPNNCKYYTSINRISGIDVSLYPNPATSQLNCTLNNLSSHTTYQIYGIDGRAVTPPTAVTQQYFSMDVSALPKGMYFLTMQDEKGRVIKKFVKQ